MVQIIKTEKDFDKLVYSAKGKVMVDFYADWCGPCQMFAPIFDSFASEHSESAFYRVNVDELSAPAAALGIDSIPAIFVFTDGKETARAVGVRDKSSLLSMLERKV